VATAEGRIPVTIRSRCRTLRVSGLAERDLRDAVMAALERDEHEVEEAALATAIRLSQGSVRRALELATGEGIELYEELVGHLGRLPELDGGALHRLADRLGGVSDGDRLELFFSLLFGLLERLIRVTATGEGAIGDECELASRLLDRLSLPQWVGAWDAIGQARADAIALNLDRNVLVLETFFTLQQAARGASA
jgi:DNA polymerase-3 subunit delta'